MGPALTPPGVRAWLLQPAAALRRALSCGANRQTLRPAGEWTRYDSALLGYVKTLSKSIRRYVALVLLLAKRRIALYWDSAVCLTEAAWIEDPIHCDTNSELYASLQPPSSRPKEIRHPLRSYLQALSPTPSVTGDGQYPHRTNPSPQAINGQ
ncbi:hypothetical protein NDU88_000821 [Pleurodeles waltl]|uniref:Uncharacterized protein n=1 Tax=Pleurodeles waltl TaxID=8319 RepID=A0AAV7WKR6_PLEWA|nr:hypothetical protein NDU88_000821 [Pleurodeles waltl]